jgi:hypothetical protein
VSGTSSMIALWLSVALYALIWSSSRPMAVMWMLCSPLVVMSRGEVRTEASNKISPRL